MRRFVFLSLMLTTFAIGAGCDKKAETPAKAGGGMAPAADPGGAVSNKPVPK